MADNLWMQAAFAMSKVAEAAQFRDELEVHNKRHQLRIEQQRRERRLRGSVGPVCAGSTEERIIPINFPSRQSNRNAILPRSRKNVRFLRGQRRPDRVDMKGHPLLDLQPKLRYAIRAKGSRLDQKA